MTRPDYIAEIRNIYQECVGIVEIKNADYANENDPFANFRNTAFAGVTVEQAILVRITDKLSRIGNLLKREAQVKDETIDDTLKDAINYLAILATWIRANKK